MEVPTKYRCTWTALCITVLMMSASIKDADTMETETLALDSMNYYFTIEIMNRIYNNSLLDPESADYKKMHGEVSGALHSVYGCSNCSTGPNYQGVQAMNFRNGSVIAESTITFKGTTTNTAVVKFLFIGALSNNPEINGLQINPASISDSYVTTTEAPRSTSTTMTTTTTPTTTTTTTTLTTTTPTTTPSTTTTPITTTTTTTTTTPSTTTTPTTITPTTTTPTTTNITTTPTTNTTTTQSTTTITTTKPETTATTTPKMTTATSTESSTAPILHPTKHPENNASSSSSSSSSSSTTTATKSSSNSKSSLVTHTGQKINNTEPVLITSNPSSNHDDGVPGWAIALLVLASIAILLLIIIILILLIRWCCVDNSNDVRSLPPQEHTPYMRTTFREPLSVPAYSPHTPQKNLYPF
ncbi:hypothetical protein QTP86_031085, partial [Hemibagrus guttatus]